MHSCIFVLFCFLFTVFFFFAVNHFLSLLNLLQYCFCFIFWFLGHEACGILAHHPGIKPAPPALEDEVLTTGPPGRSLVIIIYLPVWKTYYLDEWSETHGVLICKWYDRLGINIQHINIVHTTQHQNKQTKNKKQPH